jgi:cytochrome c
MKLVRPTFLVGTLLSAALMTARDLPASDLTTVDLTQWTPPDIAATANDPFGELVRYGYALLTDTANRSARRFQTPQNASAVTTLLARIATSRLVPNHTQCR